MNYTDIDAAILEAIRTIRAPTFGPIFRAVRVQAEAIAAQSVKVRVLGEQPQAWRIVDRRLQALKNADKIVYARKTGWTIKEA